jgi:hypothetical protein
MQSGRRSVQVMLDLRGGGASRSNCSGTPNRVVAVLPGSPPALPRVGRHHSVALIERCSNGAMRRQVKA